jgi:hypothetical protein
VHGHCSNVCDFNEEFEFPTRIEKIIFENNIGVIPGNSWGNDEAIVADDKAVCDADVFWLRGGSSGREVARDCGVAEAG